MTFQGQVTYRQNPSHMLYKGEEGAPGREALRKADKALLVEQLQATPRHEHLQANSQADPLESGTAGP